ncbi:16S rRNA (guanine(966)-N(2))-methyltransferase RsmD [Alcanivorax quisquiliarum]|uniref:Ribosomal RNA small subunit methyltransferase D n=1 Tax=Alcanivorax quisquiliarum TaxID=2933565 RepID=A0ABT0E5B7_9GAMM|nr:16S rRNA (guanine(966)-N(2))-methyltransferase RsmD [Alcanivorax quisquiliarum]MCK0537023.1 16S rRNA (guanine(966)-N(2))-methyltransferase RsmD [Alcanivorax quisquiliarum]
MSVRKGSVRIIGGQHRGRRLLFTDQDGDLRPSGDRMRETLFNWLQFKLLDRRVLDLFAGSGALAAEALSRGAAHAVVVEKKRERAADLSRQLKPIFAERVFVQAADALEWLAGDIPQAPFDLVFIDPPYDLGLASPACEALEQRNLLSTEALIYVESRRHDPAPVVPASWQLLKEASGGDMRAQLFQRSAGR